MAVALSAAETVSTDRGLVVAAEPLAAEVGAQVLRDGGNAIDAAVGTAMALASTYPRAGNLGGGGFMIVRLTDGRVFAFDFRERAPAAAHRDMYLDADGKLIPGLSTIGHRAAGVPGTVAGLDLVHRKLGSGKMSWARLVSPAQKLAEEGFIISPALAEDLSAHREFLSANAAAKRIFFRKDRTYFAGERLVQSDLAATLARVRDEGAQEFYRGRTAALIEDDMREHGGLITRQDLAAYHPVERTPLESTYRGHVIYSMPPPSSGGIALFQMLRMLEKFDVGSLPPQGAEKIHLFSEVMRRAYADRAQFLGDPDFSTIPVRQLLDEKYLRQKIADFDPRRATRSEKLASPLTLRPESPETTHFSIVDAAGNAVSCTYTLNGLYGSGAVAGKAGFLLNNEMDDFTVQRGVPNAFGLIQGPANYIEPAKRPLSSMTPVIVTRDGKVRIVTGSPGGSTIINTVLLVLVNLIDHGLSPRQAVDLPRFNHQWLPDAITHEVDFIEPSEMTTLRERGHDLRLRRLYPHDPESRAATQGSTETIVIDLNTGKRTGVADPRRPGTAAVAQ